MPTVKKLLTTKVSAERSAWIAGTITFIAAMIVPVMSYFSGPDAAFSRALTPFYLIGAAFYGLIVAGLVLLFHKLTDKKK